EVAGRHDGALPRRAEQVKDLLIGIVVEDQHLLGAEVAIDRTGRDLRRRGHPFHGDLAVAVLLEQIEGDPLDAVHGRALAALPGPLRLPRRHRRAPPRTISTTGTDSTPGPDLSRTAKDPRPHEGPGVFELLLSRHPTAIRRCRTASPAARPAGRRWRASRRRARPGWRPTARRSRRSSCRCRRWPPRPRRRPPFSPSERAASCGHPRPRRSATPTRRAA